MSKYPPKILFITYLREINRSVAGDDKKRSVNLAEFWLSGGSH